MKALLKISVALLIWCNLVPTFLKNDPNININQRYTAYAYSEERIVIASRILSVQETKSLAASQASIKNSILLNILENAAAQFGGVGGWVYSIASSLSRNAQFSNTLASAAAQNKRVKLVITDNKNYHTSYSTQVQYYIVN